MLWINVVAVTITVAALVFGWLRWRRHRSTLSVREMRDALEACGLLLDLLADMQQHRGMSSAWLGGDNSFKSRLAGKRSEIGKVFTQLVNVVAVESERSYPCFTSNDLSLFRFKWQSLNDKLHELSVEQSIAQHSHLIATVLDWLATYGEARIELPAARMLPAGAVRNFCHRLPALTECLGQARAIGTGIAVRGGCSPVARVRMMFLATRAESLLQQSAEAVAIGGTGVEGKRTVEALIRIIRNDMLASAGVSVSADSYFALATQAVDAVFAWARECSTDIDSELTHPADANRAALQALPLRHIYA